MSTSINFFVFLSRFSSSPENIRDTTKDERQTPLHYAAKNNSVGALKVLIKLGASMNDRDHRLRTPLHLAAENGKEKHENIFIHIGYLSALL